MAISIEDVEASRLAHELAALTGEDVEEAVTRALAMRLEHERRVQRVSREALRAQLREIAERASKLPVLDPRSDDEILGYNEYGTFD